MGENYRVEKMVVMVVLCMRRLRRKKKIEILL
jgi:hypothetical protein